MLHGNSSVQASWELMCTCAWHTQGVIVVEGLCLGDAAPGLYTLACLPLKLVGADGAPARCVLMR